MRISIERVDNETFRQITYHKDDNDKEYILDIKEAGLKTSLKWIADDFGEKITRLEFRK